jgi:hypothetical protein
MVIDIKIKIISKKQGPERAVEKLLSIAPIEYRSCIEKMPRQDMEGAQRLLEGLAERAAMLAGYLDERHGYGCGDQGHEKAVKTMNKYGRTVWMKIFGYNGYHELNI